MSLDPVDLEAPAKLLLPPGTSPAARNGRYIAGPQPEGTVRVVLHASSYEEPAECRPYDSYPFAPMAYQVYDLPAETVERWKAAAEAFDAMQEEIEATISARAQPPA
jgi:hypothetical protein